jgi:post-segregation antitoxin (ccd killing protein)
MAMENTRADGHGKAPVRTPSYDVDARRRTVSLTLNADLCAKANAAGMNLSRVAEDALATALTLHMAERMRADIRRDLAAHDAFVETHGSFAKLVREHYAAADDDPAV